MGSSWRMQLHSLVAQGRDGRSVFVRNFVFSLSNFYVTVSRRCGGAQSLQAAGAGLQPCCQVGLDTPALRWRSHCWQYYFHSLHLITQHACAQGYQEKRRKGAFLVQRASVSWLIRAGGVLQGLESTLELTSLGFRSGLISSGKNMHIIPIVCLIIILLLVFQRQ